MLAPPLKTPSNASPVPRSEVGIFSKGAEAWRQLLENMPLPVVVGTLEAVPELVFMNREYVRLFGYAPEEVPTIAQWMPLAYPDPAYRAEILDWWMQALGDSRSEPGLVRSREVRICAKDGRQVQAILNAIVLGRHVLVAFQDITDRRRRELELEKSNTRMQLAAGAARLGFWEYDFATQTETQDGQIHDIYGIVPGEEFGKWEDRLHPEDRQVVEDRLATALDDRSDGVDLEFRIRRPDGGIRWIRSRCRITRDAGAKPLRLTGIDCDITAEKTAQLALEEALEKAERENEAKGRFLASVSHEIRTPLSALVAMSNSMLIESESHPLPRVFTENLESVRAGGQYLNLILANLLDLSAVESGHAAVRASEFYIGDWAEDVSSILAPIAKSHGVRLEWSLPQDADALFSTDQVRLTQIVLNLAHNAVKFSLGAEAAASVSIGLEGGNLTVSVTDCGPGIDPERLPGLFGEFEQGGSVPRSGERGIGLGLAIVKRNAELLGGTVQAEANKPRGMRFSVMMPPMERRASR